MGLGQNFRDANALQGMPLGMLTKVVLLVADNTQVDVTGVSLLLLSSDNTTAANRTFTLVASSLVGHRLNILFTVGSSMKAQLADSGIQKLNGAWEPSAQYDMIELVSDGTNWVELSRNTLTQAQLSSGAASAMQVIAGGLFTTVGGDATESITATGAAATDTVFVTVNTVGGTPRTVTAAVGAANAITVTMSGDPSTDHVLNYVVLRAVS